MHKSLPKTIDYVEMPSRDLAATKGFFSTLFGWPFQDYGPDYIAFDDGRMAGGFFAAEQAWSAATAAPLVVFYAPELEQILRGSSAPRRRGYARDLRFPGGRRFHFTAPGTGEFAIWSE